MCKKLSVSQSSTRPMLRTGNIITSCQTYTPKTFCNDSLILTALAVGKISLKFTQLTIPPCIHLETSDEIIHTTIPQLLEGQRVTCYATIFSWNCKIWIRQSIYYTIVCMASSWQRVKRHFDIIDIDGQLIWKNPTNSVGERAKWFQYQQKQYNILTAMLTFLYCISSHYYLINFIVNRHVYNPVAHQDNPW